MVVLHRHLHVLQQVLLLALPLPTRRLQLQAQEVPPVEALLLVLPLQVSDPLA